MKHQTTYIHNKKALFNYEIQDTIEAGIELFGHEVKSIKNNQGSLEGAYVIVRGGEAYLINMNIPAYQTGNIPADHELTRNRKLILHKEEIKKLADVGDKGGKGNGGLTIIPLSIYNNRGRIKVEIAIARGKKKIDKRETIKKRETDREIRREMKR